MTQLANEIRPTHMPPYCSACHNQNPSLRYVDFDAACDRGYGNSEAVQIVMDDLIICEDCLRSGAIHVGMIDSATADQRIAHLEERLGLEEKLRTQAQNYATRMEQALAARTEKGQPSPVKIDHRQRPRKEIAQ